MGEAIVAQVPAVFQIRTRSYAEGYRQRPIVPRIHKVRSWAVKCVYENSEMKRATVDSATDLLTTDQVMDRLLADESLRRAAATCVLPAIRYGTEWRFRKGDLEAWIQRRRAELLQAPPTPC